MLRAPLSRISRSLPALLIAALSTVASSQEPAVAPERALAAYVAKPDLTFAWKFKRRYRHPRARTSSSSRSRRRLGRGSSGSTSCC